MDNQRFVTFRTPAPEWLKENWEFSRKLVDEADSCDDPWKKAVIFDFARRINDLDLARFCYESIGKKEENMIRYSHSIECDGKEIRTVRTGSAEPGILERMALNKFTFNNIN